MSSPAADRNLLFGILAHQMDFVSRDALVAAMNAWVLDKEKPLGRILRDSGHLAEDEFALLEGLVRKHLEKHGHDAQRSLAAVSSLRSVRRDLEQVADAEVQASLVHVSAGRADDPDATTGHVETGSAAGRRFQVLRPHARGGLGEVFVARDTEVEREVALKEIQPRHADHPDNRARFLLEARVTGALEHPGIVPVYGLGHYADGRPFYAMRFVKGDSLKDAIAAFHQAEAKARSASARSLALRQLLGRFVDVCQAIAYAHSRGVLHRDLKPGNVMLGKYGETLVVDWGLAKVLGHKESEATESALVSSGDSGLTQAGKALGTPAYMSPEQAAGRIDQLGPRSDVYSLGATLYCLLTGKPPYTEADVGAVLARVQKGDCPPPRQLNSTTPAALEAICRKAMAAKPDDRYATPNELAEEVEHWLADEPVAAYREPWPARLARAARKRPAATAGVGALLLTGVIALGVSTLLIGNAQRATAEALDNEKQARRDRALAQVNALALATPGAVPGILADLEANRDEVLPRLRLLWREEGRPERKMRLALALLPVEPESVKNDLVGWLPQVADPAELLVIREALRPHATELRGDLWKRLAAPKTTREQRLRLLAALAAFDPEGAGWKDAGAQALEAWLADNPLYLRDWTRALEPVRDSLLGPLTEVFRGKRLPERRTVVASILADYLSDRPEQLADRLADAEQAQFPVLFEVLQKQPRERVLAVLTKEVKRPAPVKAKEVEREGLARRQANAGLALLRLGEEKDVWPLLRHGPYPEARTRLVMLMGQGGVEARAVVARLEAEKDVSARRALIVALGEYAEVPGREALTRKLLSWYRDDPDPGIHGAIDWLLRHGKEGPEPRPLDWGQGKELERIDGEMAAAYQARLRRDAASLAGVALSAPLLGAALLSERRAGGEGWYVNGQGQTFTVIDGREPFLMGSLEDEAVRRAVEDQHWRKIGRRYAMQTKPVTVAQWRQFQQANPQVPRFNIKHYSPMDDGPIVVVDWYDAAAYCRWLSELEGVPEHEMVYPPVKVILERQRDDKPLKLPADHLSRTGYRLPSEAEWERACRAAVLTGRYYGSSMDLLPRHAWFISNSRSRSWPVGQKRPNDLGLFDMHGNVFTWCQESAWGYPGGTSENPAPDKEDIRYITSRLSRVQRGGSYSDLAPVVRSSYRIGFRPSIRDFTFGLRACRTLPFSRITILQPR